MEYSEDLFKQKLTEFFDRHDPTKKHLVPKIAAKYINDQETIFNHLTKTYAEKSGVTEYDISEETLFGVPTSANSGGEPY